MDSQRVPQNKLENIERQMIKVNRYIQDKFKSVENLTEQLKNYAEAEKNGNLTVDQFKDFLQDNLKDELTNNKVTKHDVQGFLSAFVYNKYGATNVEKIATLVFEKDSNTLSLKIANQVRANPPPAFVNEELGFVQPLDVNSDNSKARRVREILDQIETQSYVEKPNTYKIFKKFDVDGDGFISYKDFET